MKIVLKKTLKVNSKQKESKLIKFMIKPITNKVFGFIFN
ncbi:MAG: hypothetical protein BWY55_00664 [archaeon ADurb.Bin336]|jgi:hypothetical protein|nr:MAG: hypothetical protein BWY55_00664 [archaeon ADurb.Bin336]